MKSKDQFLDQYADQIAGFLLAAFAQEENADMTVKGRRMQQRLSSVRPLLEKMYCFITEEPIPPPEPLSMNDQVNALLKRLGRLPQEQQKLVEDKLKKSFSTNGVKEKV